MGTEAAAGNRSRCVNCGFEAPDGGEAWRRVDVPGLGRLSQCPKCESTDVITGVSIG